MLQLSVHRSVTNATAMAHQSERATTCKHDIIARHFGRFLVDLVFLSEKVTLSDSIMTWVRVEVSFGSILENKRHQERGNLVLRHRFLTALTKNAALL